MKISIVVPCYNEEEIITFCYQQLSKLLETMTERREIIDSCIVFVDDGSKDKTWEIIKGIKRNAKDAAYQVFAIKLASNVGHQNALMAGLTWSYENKYDATISIDADLQDDINCIPQMVSLAKSGSEIVYGVRNKRTSDTIFKRTTAQMFYSMMQQLGCNTIYNHADYRLTTHKALEALMQYPERNMFLRGMIKSIGLPYSIVYYERMQRTAGVSKYPFFKMLSFAIDGITSFSVKPLHIITAIGTFCLMTAVILIVYSIYQFFSNNTQPGWTSVMTSIWFVGGIIMIALGIVGEYVGKIYKEVKGRPRYFIEELF